MPLLKEHNALFIHIPRTGGTHLERILNLNCNWKEANLDKLFGTYKNDKKRFMLQHLTCQEILAHQFLSEAHFERLFKFTIVRNPYHRCPSLYYYWGGDKKWGKFESFLNHLHGLNLDDYDHLAGHYKRIYHLIPQYKYIYSEEEELLVDFVCRFENGLRDTRVLFERIGFDTGKKLFDLDKYLSKINLSKINMRFAYQRYRGKMPWGRFWKIWTEALKRKRKEGRYRALYDETTQAMVREIYAKDFELFNYKQTIL